MSWPSCVAKCASENIRGNVSRAMGATIPATGPNAVFRRTATAAHATLKRVMGPSRDAMSGSRMGEPSHLPNAIGSAEPAG